MIRGTNLVAKKPGTQTTSAAAGETTGITPGIRTALSLGLIIHLFLAFVAMTANLAPVYSRAQARVLTNFSLYTRLLAVDLNFTPFYWTHASADDVDHRIGVLPAGKRPEVDSDWIHLPDAGIRGSDRYQRYLRLARTWSLMSQQDDITAAIAKSIGTSFLEQRQVRPARVRCQRHMLQSWESIRGGTQTQRNPDDPSYFQVAYDANLVISRNGTVSVVKLAEAGEIAQPGSGGGKGNATNP
jgi:hypothetical protein